MFWGARAAISRDKDARRIWWMLNRAPLQPAHRDALVRMRGRFDWTVAERAVIRTLFRLYRPVEAVPDVR